MGEPVYIGAETITSPLGGTAAANFERILRGESGITLHKGTGWKGSDVYLSRIQDLPVTGKYAELLGKALAGISTGWDARLLSSPETQVFISSTKGDIEDNLPDPFNGVTDRLMRRFALTNRPIVLSNACISGVLAINLAARTLKSGMFRHAVVIGCDLISDFVLYGFQALYAVSDVPCRPFDLDRRGVSLGDGSGGVVLSVEKSTFMAGPMRYLAGADANDANHISGPSRTGEGLVRAVTKAMTKAGVECNQIGYVNAHGTGTNFNDEMEAIAFNRLGLENVPLNSLKGYWGHTLGAAGIIETALCLQTLRTGTIPASLGFDRPGTSKPLNIVTENASLNRRLILKTASGFGGGNAALIIAKL